MTDFIKETVLRKVSQAGGSLRVKSALNPALWLLLWSGSYITAVIKLIEIEKLILIPNLWIFIIFIPVFVPSLGFLFLLIFDRDKLQSEEFQIKKQSLELIEQKGGRIIVNPAQIESISNPNYHSLSNDIGEKENE